MQTFDRTPAIHAAAHGHDEVLLALVRAGANANYATAAGRTALFKAARVGRRRYEEGKLTVTPGHATCVFHLLDAGAAVGADVKGHVPRDMLRDLRARFTWPAWSPDTHARHPREFRAVVRLLCLQRARERPFELTQGQLTHRPMLPCSASRAREVRAEVTRGREARAAALERAQPPAWRAAAARACERVLSLRGPSATGTGTTPGTFPRHASRGRFMGWSSRVDARVSAVADRPVLAPLTPSVADFGIAPARAMLRGGADDRLVPVLAAVDEEQGGGGDCRRDRPACLGDLPDEIFWGILELASTSPATYFSRLTN